MVMTTGPGGPRRSRAHGSDGTPGTRRPPFDFPAEAFPKTFIDSFLAPFRIAPAVSPATPAAGSSDRQPPAIRRPARYGASPKAHDWLGDLLHVDPEVWKAPAIELSGTIPRTYARCYEFSGAILHKILGLFLIIFGLQAPCELTGARPEKPPGSPADGPDRGCGDGANGLPTLNRFDRAWRDGEETRWRGCSRAHARDYAAFLGFFSQNFPESASRKASAIVNMTDAVPTRRRSCGSPEGPRSAGLPPRPTTSPSA
jgi:hypothetical protein